jgi:hypothetical protein
MRGSVSSTFVNLLAVLDLRRSGFTGATCSGCPADLHHRGETMKKLKLEMDALEVTTFTTAARRETVARGTLYAHAVKTFPCLTGTETYTCPTSAATCPTC